MPIALVACTRSCFTAFSRASPVAPCDSLRLSRLVINWTFFDATRDASRWSAQNTKASAPYEINRRDRRLRCRGVADSLEEAGERLFTFLRYPPQQWKSLRTTNAIERLHGEFKRRVKTQCALPNAETAAMLFWALMASGQITMRRVGGWQTLDQAPVKKPIDLAA